MSTLTPGTPRPNLSNPLGLDIGTTTRPPDAGSPAYTDRPEGDGVVVFAPKAELTDIGKAQYRDYIDSFNTFVEKIDYDSHQGRVATGKGRGSLRAAANQAKEAERARAEAAGAPYTDQVGHGPDSTWTGTAAGEWWTNQTSAVNQSAGGTAPRYPPGFKPSGAQVQFSDGEHYPPTPGTTAAVAVDQPGDGTSQAHRSSPAGRHAASFPAKPTARPPGGATRPQRAATPPGRGAGLGR